MEELSIKIATYYPINLNCITIANKVYLVPSKDTNFTDKQLQNVLDMNIFKENLIYLYVYIIIFILLILVGIFVNIIVIITYKYGEKNKFLFNKRASIVNYQANRISSLSRRNTNQNLEINIQEMGRKFNNGDKFLVNNNENLVLNFNKNQQPISPLSSHKTRRITLADVSLNKTTQASSLNQSFYYKQKIINQKSASNNLENFRSNLKKIDDDFQLTDDEEIVLKKAIKNETDTLKNKGIYLANDENLIGPVKRIFLNKHKNSNVSINRRFDSSSKIDQDLNSTNANNQIYYKNSSIDYNNSTFFGSLTKSEKHNLGIINRGITRRTLSSFFILNLGLCDLFICLINMPFNLTIQTGNFLNIEFDYLLKLLKNDFWCKLVYFFIQVPIVLEIEILLTIALDRYFSVFRPIKLYNFDRKKLKIILFVQFLLSIIICLPNVFFYVSIKNLDQHFSSNFVNESSINQKIKSLNSYCKIEDSFTGLYVYYQILLFVLFIVNLLIISICYLKVYNHVYMASIHQRRETITSSSNNNNSFINQYSLNLKLRNNGSTSNVKQFNENSIEDNLIHCLTKQQRKSDNYIQQFSNKNNTKEANSYFSNMGDDDELDEDIKIKKKNLSLLREDLSGSCNKINKYNNLPCINQSDIKLKFSKSTINSRQNFLYKQHSLNINSDKYKSFDGIYLTSFSLPYQKDNNFKSPIGSPCYLSKTLINSTNIDSKSNEVLLKQKRSLFRSTKNISKSTSSTSSLKNSYNRQNSNIKNFKSANIISRMSRLTYRHKKEPCLSSMENASNRSSSLSEYNPSTSNQSVAAAAAIATAAVAVASMPISIRRHTCRKFKHGKTARVLGIATFALALTWSPYFYYTFKLISSYFKRRSCIQSFLYTINNGNSILNISEIYLKNAYYLNYVFNPIFYSFVDQRFRQNVYCLFKRAYNDFTAIFKCCLPILSHLKYSKSINACEINNEPDEKITFQNQAILTTVHKNINNKKGSNASIIEVSK